MVMILGVPMFRIIWYLYILYFIQKTDVMGKLVADLIDKTHEFLQPNPGKITCGLNVLSVCQFGKRVCNASN